MDAIPKFFESSSLTFSINVIEEDSLIQTRPLPPTSGGYASSCEEWGDNRQILRFLDHEKWIEFPMLLFQWASLPSLLIIMSLVSSWITEVHEILFTLNFFLKYI